MTAQTAAQLQTRRWIAHGLLASAFLICSALVMWPPERVAFYPLCPVWQYLHILCPGCGVTRALAALLRGHLTEAIRFNPLFVALLPVGVAAGLAAYRRALRPGLFLRPTLPPAGVWAALTAAAVFTLLRNLPSWAAL